MSGRFDENGNFTVPPTEHARLRAEKLAAPGDLVAEARAMAATSVANSSRMIHRLADEIERLRIERDQHAETARQTTNHAVDNATTIAAIRHALAGHPSCDVHPDDDVISCGWKRAVASVQWALDTTEPTTEENPDV